MSGEHTLMRQVGAYLLALAIGCAGALLLAHYAACESSDQFTCLWSQ